MQCSHHHQYRDPILSHPNPRHNFWAGTIFDVEWRGIFIPSSMTRTKSSLKTRMGTTSDHQATGEAQWGPTSHLDLLVNLLSWAHIQVIGYRHFLVLSSWLANTSPLNKVLLSGPSPRPTASFYLFIFLATSPRMNSWIMVISHVTFLFSLSYRSPPLPNSHLTVRATKQYFTITKS